MKKIRKIKEMRPAVSSDLNVSTAVTSVTDADAQNALNHKVTKRQKQQIHQLRIRHPPPNTHTHIHKPQAEQGGAE